MKMKENNNNFGGILYENDIESNQAGIINLGMALNCDYIILNGVNMSDQKITKIKEYIEELDSISNEENTGEENEPKIEENKENNENQENKENDGNKENIQEKINEAARKKCL